MNDKENSPFLLDPVLAGVLARWICGDKLPFIYRSSSKFGPFFRSAGFSSWPEHDGSTRKSWVVARLGEYVDSQNKLEQIMTGIANPRHFVAGDAVDEDRWRDAIRAMNKRLALDGWRVTEHRVGVRLERVQERMPGGALADQSADAVAGAWGAVTSELLTLLGQMVVGDKAFGHFKGSGGATTFHAAGWDVTERCPTPGWERWAENQMRIWLDADGEAVEKLLKAMAAPSEFLDKQNRVKVDERLAQIEKWNGFLAPHGLKIAVSARGANVERTAPAYLDAEPKEAAEILGESLPPDWALCRGSDAMRHRWQERWAEYNRCRSGGANLAAVILLGSIMEALILSAIEGSPMAANTAKSAPRKKDQSVLSFKEWTLDNLINVAHELTMIQRDRKDFASSLRDWRNIVHLRHAVDGDFVVDKHTVATCESVVRGVVADLGTRTEKRHD